MNQKNTIKNNQFLSLIKSVLVTKGQDITCGDCDEEAARYADMIQAGDDPAQILPHIKLHLDCCDGCKEQMEALAIMVEAQAKDNGELSL